MKKFPLPKKEKEERVCELLKQGKGFRYIAADQHVSFSDIEKVKNKYFETDDDDLPQNSKRSQALKLMEEGKSSLDIAIELNLSSDEVQGFRQEYLTLKGEDHLLGIYRRIRGKTEPFLKLYEMMTEEDISPEEAVWTLQDYGSFKNIEKQFTDLTKRLRPLRDEVDQLEKQGQALAGENENLKDERDQLQIRNEGLARENENLRDERDQLQTRKQELGSIVQAMAGIIDRDLQNDNALEQTGGQLDLDWIGKTPRKPEDRLGQAADEPEKELSD